MQRADLSLVTGATGYVGSNLIQRLCDDGAAVRVLQRPEGRSALPELPVERAAVDLMDLPGLTEAMAGICTVYHLAGTGSPASGPQAYRQIMETNVTGTLHVLSAAAEAGVRRVVVASSAAVYGRLDSSTLREEAVPQPASPYGVSKFAAEQLCQAFQHGYNMKAVALRYFNVYGPRQDESRESKKLIPSLIRSLQKGEPITVYGDGQQTRDFVYIDDVVTGTIRAGSCLDTSVQVINIGSGQPVSIMHVITALSSRLGVRAEVVHMPERPTEIQHSSADLRTASLELEYRPTISFAEGIAQFAEGSQREECSNA